MIIVSLYYKLTIQYREQFYLIFKSLSIDTIVKSVDLSTGIQTALALMKKASLEPLQEKDSSTANVSPKEERQGFKVRKKMLR